MWSAFVGRYASASGVRLFVKTTDPVGHTERWRVTASSAGEVVFDQPGFPGDYRYQTLNGDLVFVDRGVAHRVEEADSPLPTLIALLLSSPNDIPTQAVTNTSPFRGVIGGVVVFRLGQGTDFEALLSFVDTAPFQFAIIEADEVELKGQIRLEEIDPVLPGDFFTQGAAAPTPAEVAAFRQAFSGTR